VAKRSLNGYTVGWQVGFSCLSLSGMCRGLYGNMLWDIMGQISYIKDKRARVSFRGDHWPLWANINDTNNFLRMLDGHT
jgi:hypothetical protein